MLQMDAKSWLHDPCDARFCSSFDIKFRQRIPGGFVLSSSCEEKLKMKENIGARNWPGKEEK